MRKREATEHKERPPPRRRILFGDEEGKNAQTFCKSHGDNAKGQDVTESAWVTADSFHCLGADETHADCGTSATPQPACSRRK